ncbi:non-canonical purine NTP pyrophosphatase, RdgB/HAM1 family [Candidatus Fermentibacteria bacterium]|nr:MAG: non-canonical purine NTP pyrophosphatase, RdgB/HAM1 family [Candidatus Fermentibacteria bacterium]
MKLVLASANPDKLTELRKLLNQHDIVAIGELIPEWDVEETGLTLEENALLKARSAAEATGITAIADDTGLFVWALGGAPGVYTARYAGEKCSYSDNTEKLLTALKGENGDRRKAHFRTVIAMVTPQGDEHIFQGRVEGVIADKHRGDSGFGYDPVFYSFELGCTFSECTPEEKSSVSHRGRAIRALMDYLAALK